MLLLSVIAALSFSSWGQPDSKQVNKLITQYINSVGENKFPKKLYSDLFLPFIEHDKVIFATCGKVRCKVEASSKSMKHDSSLWMVKVQVSQKGKKFKSRQGCYFAKKVKKKFILEAYVEDCNSR